MDDRPNSPAKRLLPSIIIAICFGIGSDLTNFKYFFSRAREIDANMAELISETLTPPGKTVDNVNCALAY